MDNISFKPEIISLIRKKNFETFTPIQEKCIPLILKGRDVIGISATGTGKSHAFILPILQMVNTDRDLIQAVVATPTRELARQLYQQFVQINEFSDAYRIKLIASGIDKERMMGELKQQPHIVIGTIGRLKDLYVDEQVLRLDTARIMVIDEADMTLEMAFIEEVDQLCGKMSRNLQMVTFSATIPPQLQPFLKKYMNNPVIVEAKEKHANNPQIEHVLINCRHLSYEEKLLRILPGINPYVCLIFSRNKQEVKSVAAAMKQNGYPVLEIHGDLTPRERKQALKMLDSDQASYVVCSDVMARGIDFPSVSHVISLGLPYELDYYTHRSGRTGRAGRTGISYLLYKESDIRSIKVLQNGGISFASKDYRNGEWKDVKPFDFKPRRRKTEADIQIEKIVNKPVKQVKPGYKKKRQQEIDDIRRRERRLMIKQSIREQQKERAKKKQLSKVRKYD
ncbi:MAG: DEAD/DEAH box helicase [Erysipelotrichaceae bacterium]|nr:DEAD/DEAH box helicase [Erysipelotrichaceae bacterium]